MKGIIICLWVAATMQLIKSNEIDYICPDEGYFRLPHPYKCELFIECLEGVTIIRECDSDFHFNPIYSMCEPPEFVNCVQKEPESDSSTTDTPIDGNSTDPDITTWSTDTTNEGNSTDSETTTWTTDTTNEGNSTDPEVTTWTTDTTNEANSTDPDITTWSTDTTNEGNSTDSETTTWITDTTNEGSSTDPTDVTTGTTDGPTGYSCPDEGNFRLPHPYKCELFIECVEGVATIGECDEGFYFNPNYSSCDPQEYVNCDPKDPPTTDTPTEETSLVTDPTNEGNSTDPDVTTWSTDTTNEGSSTDPTDVTTGTTDGPTEFSCPDEGNFRLPHPYKCELFIQCVEGVATVRQCDEGFYFNPIHSSCDPPEFVNCDPIDPPTTDTPTDETSLVTDPTNEWNSTDPTDVTTGTTDDPTEYYCPDEGHFILPYPNACDKFITCADGNKTIGQCYPPLLFNPVHSFCDLPEYVNCESGTEQPTTEPTLTTDEPTDGNTTEPTPDTTWTTDGSIDGNTTAPTEVPTEHPDEGCDASLCTAINGVFVDLIPHRTNCSKFCKCDWGVAHSYDCSPGLHFNPEKSVCDWPLSAGCTATATPTMVPTTEPATESTEPTEVTTETTIEATTEQSSEPTESSSEATMSSSEPPVSSSEPTFPTTEATTENPDNGIDVTVECPGDEQARYPHPSSCSHYIDCTDGKATIVECVEGFEYNPDVSSCDNPENFTCDIALNPVEPEPPQDSEEDITEESAETNPLGQCSPVNGDYVDFLPDAKHCDRFYKCVWGTPVLTYCPSGLHFNPSLNVCDWPRAAGCTAGATKPDEELDQETEVDADGEDEDEVVGPGSEEEVRPDEEVDQEADTEVDREINVDGFVCPSEGVYRLPHPKSCSHFVDCVNGQAILGVCEYDFQWNNEFGTCDIPDEANCQIVEEEEEQEGIPEESEEGEVEEGQSEEQVVSEEEVPEEAGPQPGPVGSCTSENGVYVDFLTDGWYCDRFYKCDWGNPVLFTCPAGLHFNPRANVCDWPASAGCTAPN